MSKESGIPLEEIKVSVMTLEKYSRGKLLFFEMEKGVPLSTVQVTLSTQWR